MVRWTRAIRSEERFSRNAETDLVCRLLLEKKNICFVKMKSNQRKIGETGSDQCPRCEINPIRRREISGHKGMSRGFLQLVRTRIQPPRHAQDPEANQCRNEQHAESGPVSAVEIKNQ